jgi:hypothetical protein
LIAPPIELRPAQHFDALKVHEVEQRARQRRDIDIVDIDADAGFQRVVEVGLADAANERDQADTAALRLVAQGHVRRLRGDLRNIGLPARFEHRRIDRSDRQRRILQLLRAELRGDDDFLRRVGSGRLVCGLRRAGFLRHGRHCNHCCGHAGKTRDALGGHKLGHVTLPSSASCSHDLV